MKKILAVLLLTISGCSTELDLLHPAQTIPVIYSFINPYDSVHFVRIQRTFIISEKSDLTSLTNDSLLFKNVKVILQGKKADSVLWSENFQEVTADKDTGFFPSGPYKVYGLFKKLPINLGNPDGPLSTRMPVIDSLILIVKINDLNIISRSSTEALPPGAINPLSHPREISLYNYPTGFSMALVTPLMCIPVGSRDSCYQKIEFTLFYKEYYKTTFIADRIDWSTSSGFYNRKYVLTPERIFNRMMMLLPRNDSIQVRVLDSVNVKMIAPSKVFSDYWYVRKHWEEMDLPPYSNFDHSYGLFVTLMEGKLTGLKLDYQSMDSLCTSDKYKDMKFKHW